MEIAMCIETNHEAVHPARGSVAACGECIQLTPELRTRLQICVNSVELLAELPLPPDAHRYLDWIDQAVEALGRVSFVGSGSNSRAPRSPGFHCAAVSNDSRQASHVRTRAIQIDPNPFFRPTISTPRRCYVGLP
ncbi:hypothetical protein J7E70_18385, partial [Variovorax paradoxus]